MGVLGPPPKSCATLGARRTDTQEGEKGGAVGILSGTAVPKRSWTSLSKGNIEGKGKIGAPSFSRPDASAGDRRRCGGRGGVARPVRSCAHAGGKGRHL